MTREAGRMAKANDSMFIASVFNFPFAKQGINFVSNFHVTISKLPFKNDVGFVSRHSSEL